jgi:hypothetical protein
MTESSSFNSWQGSDFSLLQNGQTSSETQLASYSAVLVGSVRDKTTKASRLSHASFSVEFKNVWSYTSIFQYAFTACTQGKLSFTFTVQLKI